MDPAKTDVPESGVFTLSPSRKFMHISARSKLASPSGGFLRVPGCAIGNMRGYRVSSRFVAQMHRPSRREQDGLRPARTHAAAGWERFKTTSQTRTKRLKNRIPHMQFLRARRVMNGRRTCKAQCGLQQVLRSSKLQRSSHRLFARDPWVVSLMRPKQRQFRHPWPAKREKSRS